MRNHGTSRSEDFGDDTGCGPSHGRLKLNNHLRPETAALVDVCLTESTLGVSRTVLGGLPTSLNFMTVRRPDPSAPSVGGDSFFSHGRGETSGAVQRV